MLSSLKRNGGNFPDGPVVKNPPWIAEDEVQSLAAEIRSCMPQSVTKKKREGALKFQEEKYNWYNCHYLQMMLNALNTEKNTSRYYGKQCESLAR